MKSFINRIAADKITFRIFLLSFLLNMLTYFYIIINYKDLPLFVPVFNQLPWGNERLTSSLGIFIPVAVFSVIFIVNVIFASAVYSKNPLIARILGAVTLLIAITNFLFTVRTVLIII